MTPSVAVATISTPAELYGDFFAQVQLRALLADGKTFVDALPRSSPEEIMNAFRDLPRDDIALTEFLHDRFVLPATVAVPDARIGGMLRSHIRALWNELERGPDPLEPTGSALSVPGRYIVPGGRFRELYYWDSYFSMLGLVRDGQRDLAEQMLEGFTDLIERYGHIPNGARSYYIGRSQPPFYAAMVELLPHPDPAVMRRRLDALMAEHAFWMDGADGLTPGSALGRCVAMPDGTILNRHWDQRDTPRDESFREDVETCSEAPHRDPAQMCRDIRAAAESGWDFSSRWFSDGGGLASIHTTKIVPVDLNAFLHRLESLISRLSRDLYDHRAADHFKMLARRRAKAIAHFLWSEPLGAFVDYDCGSSRPSAQITAATLAPLFVGLATPDQAAATARVVADRLLGPGGLRTTTIETGEQWDWPNGWAPLQWMAFVGLDRYGHRDLARAIAARWTTMVRADFDRTGWLHEKYDVERCTAGHGGEYVPQHGFGWTNGVTAAFMDILGPSAFG